MASKASKASKAGKKKKRSKHAIKVGALGPAAHWLDLSVLQRAQTRQYIKEGLRGYTRTDGVKVPGARRIYKGLEASKGYDLRHIERWSAARLKTARNRIQSLNTLTGRPFAVLIPRTKKQRLEAQKFSGQNLPYQKEMIIPVQLTGRDKAIFRDSKVAIERKFPGGSKTLKQRFLFSDYLKSGESAPVTFSGMVGITKRMMPDMPAHVYGKPAFYTLVTVQYGPIGRSAEQEVILDLLRYYYTTYDPGTKGFPGHADFAEQVIGFQMVGTFAQMSAYEIQRDRLSIERKKRNKLRFSKRSKAIGRR